MDITHITQDPIGDEVSNLRGWHRLANIDTGLQAQNMACIVLEAEQLLGSEDLLFLGRVSWTHDDK